MACFLFGSSNVYRNFAKALETGLFAGRNLQLVRCTKKAVLDSHLATLTSAKLVVTSVLENFITEVCTGVPDGGVQLFAHQQIKAHVDTLHELVLRLPDVNVVICPLMYRTTPDWFGAYLPDFLGFLASEVSRTGTNRLSLCQPFVVLPSLLEPDGVHLMPAGGEKFLAYLDNQLEQLELEQLLADPQPTPDQMEVSVVPVAASTDPSSSSLSDRVVQLSRKTAEFEAFV